MSEQIPFGGDDFGAGLGFAENPEPRCPCILLLDTSGSMSGNPIIQLNEGLHSFKDELTADSLAAKRVEIALLTFGGQVQILYDFTSAQYFNPPAVTAGGALAGLFLSYCTSVYIASLPAAATPAAAGPRPTPESHHPDKAELQTVDPRTDKLVESAAQYGLQGDLEPADVDILKNYRLIIMGAIHHLATLPVS